MVQEKQKQRSRISLSLPFSGMRLINSLSTIIIIQVHGWCRVVHHRNHTTQLRSLNLLQHRPCRQCTRPFVGTRNTAQSAPASCLVNLSAREVLALYASCPQACQSVVLPAFSHRKCSRLLLNCTVQDCCNQLQFQRQQVYAESFDKQSVISLAPTP